MSGINLKGKDYAGTGSGVQLDEAGTYECTLQSASIYKNNKYQSDEETVQVTLVWDTGLIGENDDGEEVPVLIYDAWLTLSLNAKSNLIKRLTALAGGTLNPETADVHIGGVTNLDTLPHWKDTRTDITTFTLNGENLYGKNALVSITINDKGYPKVTGVTAPPAATPAGGKFKPRTTTAENEPPAGMPL